MKALELISVQPSIVYSPHYDIGLLGLERLHPFDTRKYSRAYRALRSTFGRKLKQITIAPSRPIRRDELLAVHASPYLRQLKNRAYLARALEISHLRRVPTWLTDWCVLRPMRWATMGTILAAREAMRTGLAINLAGGYHHASADQGEGFCIYSDIALAIHDLRESEALAPHDKVAYIDLDAHQGNGVCHLLFDDSRLFIFDMYNQAIYPAWDEKAKRRIDCAVPLPRHCHEKDYLSALRSRLPAFLDGITRSGDVKFAIYNAGTDIFSEDPLGQMNVSANGVLLRDRFVIDQLTQRRIPTLMLPSGGYTRESYRLIANSVSSFISRKGMM